MPYFEPGGVILGLRLSSIGLTDRCSLSVRRRKLNDRLAFSEYSFQGAYGRRSHRRLPDGACAARETRGPVAVKNQFLAREKYGGLPLMASGDERKTRTPRDHFKRMAEDELAKFVRKERALQQAERDERAKQLGLPISRRVRLSDQARK